MKKYLLASLIFSLHTPSAQAGLFDDFWKMPQELNKGQHERAHESTTSLYGESDLPASTKSSCFSVEGRLAPEVTVAAIKAQKSGPDATPVSWVWPKIMVHNGQKTFSGTVCLTDGPGAYEVKVVASTAPETENGFYRLDTLVRAAAVENLDARPFNRFLFPSGNVQSNDREIIEIARSITLNARTPREKAKAVHDWVARNVRYDVDGYFAYLAGDQERSFQNQPLDAITVLRDRVSVCQGYSYLAAALLRAVGVPSKVVTGQANPTPIEWTAANLKDERYGHAWNEVMIDGEWQPMDITWDAGGVDYATKIFSYSYSERFFGGTNLFHETHIKTAVLEE